MPDFKNMSEGMFILLFGGIMAGVFALSLGFFWLDLEYSDNDVIRHYQIEKAQRRVAVAKNNVRTVIVGDSSAGTSIDAVAFSRLTGMGTENYALTGSFGIVGSANMLARAVLHNPGLRNAIIVHTPFIWTRHFSKQGYFDTTPEFNQVLPGLVDGPLLEWIKMALNLKEIQWGFAALAGGGSKRPISAEEDYLQSSPKRYSNGALMLNMRELVSDRINDDKLKELDVLVSVCRRHGLNCIFIHGPLHTTIAEASKTALASLQTQLEIYNGRNNFQILPDYIYLRETMVGDSADHVDPFYRNYVTGLYAHRLKSFLR
jgi:hypothetical protein